MTQPNPPERGFTRATVLAAGGGAWSKLVTCLRCGAAILIDPRDEESATTLHLKWHNDQEQAVEIAHGRTREQLARARRAEDRVKQQARVIRLRLKDPEPMPCGLPTVQAGTDGFCTLPAGHPGACVTATTPTPRRTPNDPDPA